MRLIRDGLFGTTFIRDGNILYFRLERITELNSEAWRKYTKATGRMCILSCSISLHKNRKGLPFDESKKVIGFDEKEYNSFLEEIDKLEDKTIRILDCTSAGSNFISTGFYSDMLTYIAYITTNPDFDIVTASPLPPFTSPDTRSEEDITLKEYINFYSDIVICIGSNFSGKDSYHNRGIFRNPYWVFKQKYNNLSIVLHGYIALVAHLYYPSLTSMEVRPIGSMACLLKKYLHRGDCLLGDVDIKDIEVTPLSSEIGTLTINNKALVRIISNMFS
jgi:hypothetical protein